MFRTINKFLKFNIVLKKFSMIISFNFGSISIVWNALSISPFDKSRFFSSIGFSGYAMSSTMSSLLVVEKQKNFVHHYMFQNLRPMIIENGICLITQWKECIKKYNLSTHKSRITWNVSNDLSYHVFL